MPHPTESILERVPRLSFDDSNVASWREFDEDALTGLNPRYVAYARAHGYRIPARRNDLFTSWLMPAWNAYFVEIGELPIVQPQGYPKPDADLVRGLLVLEHGTKFDEWLMENFPPLDVVHLGPVREIGGPSL